MKRYPIRLSTWHIRELPKEPTNLVDIDDLFSDRNLRKVRSNPKDRKKEFIVQDIIVSGTHKEIPRMINSPHYLFRVFSSIFGKEKAQSKIDGGRYEVVRIELNKETKGMGFGCLTD
jgi:hypothetical protein